MPDPLPPGLYETLLTDALRTRVGEHREAGGAAYLDASEDTLRPELLARAVYLAAKRAFGSVRAGNVGGP